MIAGLRHGRTLGTPLAFLVRNRDHANWEWGMSPWPPEGEPYGKGTKPGRCLVRGMPIWRGRSSTASTTRGRARAGERSSDRVTVAAGAVAKALLAQIGSRSPARCSRWATSTRPRRTVTRLAASSRCERAGPPGLGSYASKEDRLDTRLAAALMGIQAVKGVEVGDGFALLSSAARPPTTRSFAASGAPTARRTGRRHRGRRLERRGGRRPRRDEAAADPDAPLPLGRPGDRRSPRRRSSSAATSRQSKPCPSSPKLVAFELARAAREKFGGDAIGDFVAAHGAYLERIPWSAR